MIDRSYRNIIATIALALFAFFWMTIDSQLRALDVRLRCIEQQTAAISTALDIHMGGSISSARPKSGAAMASPLEDRRKP